MRIERFHLRRLQGWTYQCRKLAGWLHLQRGVIKAISQINESDDVRDQLATNAPFDTVVSQELVELCLIKWPALNLSCFRLPCRAAYTAAHAYPKKFILVAFQAG